MAAPELLFQNYTLTAPQQTGAKPISFTQDWLGLLVRVDEVSGTDARMQLGIQWSHTGSAPWFDATALGTITAPGTYIQSLQVQACYWRLRANITGTDPSFTCTAATMV